MAKVTSFSVPDKTRDQLDKIIDQMATKTGETVSMAGAICEAVDYYYQHESIEVIIDLVDSFIGKALGVGIELKYSPAQDIKDGNIDKAIKDIDGIVEYAVEQDKMEIAIYGNKIRRLLDRHKEE